MLTLSAPAKLNLFLHITGRRSDNYHELQTLFQLLDYGDELQFAPNSTGQISLSCSLKALETDNNLVLQAARALLAYRNNGAGCSIYLNKLLPLGAGLGGGSSDAATTLVALNALWGCNLETQALMDIGAKLGADVPIFVLGASAWAEGIGEKLQIHQIPELWYLVVTPPCKAETLEVFSHPRLTRNSAPIRIPAFSFSSTRNDCQAVSTKLYPMIQEALNWLSQFGEARMTGTGSSVFISFSESDQAKDILAQLPTKFSGFVARGVNRSPLYQDFDQRVKQAVESAK